jgi:hypothetical protein
VGPHPNQARSLFWKAEELVIKISKLAAILDAIRAVLQNVVLPLLCPLLGYIRKDSILRELSIPSIILHNIMDIGSLFSVKVRHQIDSQAEFD